GNIRALAAFRQNPTAAFSQGKASPDEETRLARKVPATSCHHQPTEKPRQTRRPDSFEMAERFLPVSTTALLRIIAEPPSGKKRKKKH
ncbi:MAG: hypothetical protein BJ554DRAFT_3961, partial [Olpidium bornovanus]